MSLRTKLTIGLGFLFLIIFALAIYSSYDIQALSNDADKILKDNYDTLVYCKNMLLALDDMSIAVNGGKAGRLSPYESNLFETSRQTFEHNLALEEGNITESHERDYVEELISDYGAFLKLCTQIHQTEIRAPALSEDFISSYTRTRQTVVRINDLNMQAVERKSLETKHDSRNMILSLAAVGVVCVLLAFFYLWYFPFYISNTLAYLTNKMKELLKTAGITATLKTRDETLILLKSIELLEHQFGKSKQITN